MAKSQQTYNKIEKEKARQKKREEKLKKKEARKAESKDSQGIQFAYVDQYGNLTDTPPDPSEKIKVEAEDIVLGIPKKDDSDIEEVDPIRKGKVSFFDSSKGFGFIIDAENSEKYFCHVSGLLDTIIENDKVQFELERGMKGMNAVRVKKI
ncbi:cold-shock protein [Formosa algae]|uniref:Cold shock CspA family protein n=1 Tax=Formosa algae TaxID=225843 RepID=A0A9X1C9I7_9FLAO|nr:cold shock domain-containing protein [Formosa algae]MBP1841186.1 cold shock CspA family protein [Formosa algae]MDQ0336394.1 cold shock CspA family protein [Formosa algae]OEI81359.1 DNA-binding protein [Formosa algae]